MQRSFVVIIAEEFIADGGHGISGKVGTYLAIENKNHFFSYNRVVAK